MNILPNFFLILIIQTSPFISAELSKNLSCYQCIRHTNMQCEPFELKPCPSISDRCVTHISKNAESGFTIKRECGLGPCTFDDVMANKGLGFDHCDTSRPEYFCISCCRESGCNKSPKSVYYTSYVMLLSLMFALFTNKVMLW